MHRLSRILSRGKCKNSARQLPSSEEGLGLEIQAADSRQRWFGRGFEPASGGDGAGGNQPPTMLAEPKLPTKGFCSRVEVAVCATVFLDRRIHVVWSMRIGAAV